MPFPRVAAKAAVHRALLRISDFPSSWHASRENDNTPDSKKADVKVAHCLGISVQEFNGTGPKEVDVESPDFNGPGGVEGASEEVSIGTVANQAKEFKVYQRQSALNCLAAYFNHAIGSGAGKGYKVGHWIVEPIGAPSQGDQSLAFRITASVSHAGLDIPVYVDVVIVLSGNSAVILDFESGLAPFPASKEALITGKAMARLKAAKVPAT